jgi:glycerol uptake facilitator-like aquaporin
MILRARGGSRPLPLSYAGYEFLLTTSLLFSVVTAVRWLRDPASGAYISALRPAECGCMIALTVLVGNFLAYPAYNRWLPETIALAVALIIFLLGPITGGIVNPARQFGPAVLAGQTTDLWIYLTAPIVGAVLGAGLHHLLYRRFKTRQPLTYKLAGSRAPSD